MSPKPGSPTSALHMRVAQSRMNVCGKGSIQDAPLHHDLLASGPSIPSCAAKLADKSLTRIFVYRTGAGSCHTWQKNILFLHSRKKYFVFAFPHQRSALDIFILHQPRRVAAFRSLCGLCCCCCCCCCWKSEGGGPMLGGSCWEGVGRGAGDPCSGQLTTHCLD